MTTIEEFLAALPYLMRTEPVACEPITIAADTSLLGPTTWWQAETTGSRTENDPEDEGDEQVEQAA
ncbi:hypothetical protein [Amycolatopsis sp. NPDC051071]|uniref:hypothetical protein n=1 Tax=Amycolatopsis sp. NPDC051071 TaxID=3154637 RepID=UPI00341AFB88